MGDSEVAAELNGETWVVLTRETGQFRKVPATRPGNKFPVFHRVDQQAAT